MSHFFLTILFAAVIVNINDPQIQIVQPVMSSDNERFIHTVLTITLQGKDISMFSLRRGMLEVDCPKHREIVYKGYLTNLFQIGVGLRFGSQPWLAKRDVIITPEFEGDCTINFWTDGLSASGRWIKWNRKLTTAGFRAVYRPIGQYIPSDNTSLHRKTRTVDHIPALHNSKNS